MRVVLQRVSHASVRVEGQIVGDVGPGLVLFLGIKVGDTLRDIQYLVDKIVHLRIFGDANDKMNLSALDTRAELLVVSQFTLYGDVRRGRRPSFTDAASPAEAQVLYQIFLDELGKQGLKVAAGVFQAMMQVELCNDGPVTLVVDSIVS